MTRIDGVVLRTLLGGVCTLIVAMGVGRFAYTAILPAMQAGTGMSYDTAGLLASANYAGYLVGALGVSLLRSGDVRLWSFRVALVISVLATGLMAATPFLSVWLALRLLSGIASGVLFVLSADVVMRVLAREGRLGLAGVHFSGVGIGIALSGLLVPVLEGLWDWRADWLGLALVCVCLGLPAWLWIRDDETPGSGGGAGKPASVPGEQPARRYPISILAAAYFLEGFGYIVSGTFLVAIVAAGSSGGGLLGPLAWVMVGLAGAPSCILWALVARRTGYVSCLLVAHVLQAGAIAVPIVSVQPTPALISALVFGSTFMGITTLVIAFGREVAPGSPHRTIALLTAAFGLGQILGPLVAGALTARTGSFEAALAVAATAVVLAGALLIAGTLARARDGAEVRAVRDPSP